MQFRVYDFMQSLPQLCEVGGGSGVLGAFIVQEVSYALEKIEDYIANKCHNLFSKSGRLS